MRFRFAAFLGAGLLASCGGEPPSQGQMPPPEVTVVTLASQPVRLVRELPGRTRASVIAEVRPQVSGIIQKLLFEEGSMVEAGDPLYQIDDAIYRAELNTARATLAKADANLEAVRQRAQRASELVKTKVISEQAYEAEVAALGQAQADVEAAKAAVETARVTLGYARIVAPISGRTGRSDVTPGALVTANQETALATVQQLDPIYVDVAQSSTEWIELQRDLAAGKLRRDETLSVRVILEDGSEYAHAGKLKFSDVSVEPTTGAYNLRVVVPNPDGLLLPGMYVRALLDLGVRPEGVLAPQRGITRDPRGNAMAMVVNAEGMVEVRQVRTRNAVGDQWLVEEGLNAGDRVIVEGLQKIQPGIPVKAVEQTTAAGD